MSIFTTIANAATAVGKFISTEIGKISGEATIVISTLEDISSIANGLVNALKGFIASPTGQLLEEVIQAVPGIGPYATDIINWLPTIVQDLGWAQSEFTKSPAQVLQDGLNVAISNPNLNVKATNLITLAAHITTQLGVLAQTPVSIQAASTLAPTIYANVASEIISDIAPNSAVAKVASVAAKLA